jgi:hypothetical protein
MVVLQAVVLVTLGGCHLLDGLVVVSLKPTRSLCGAPEKSFVRNIVLAEIPSLVLVINDTKLLMPLYQVN